MTVELIVLDHFKRTFGHLVNMLRLEKIFKMFRVITIEKSHQTTRFRHYHTQQADKQPVSNKPVAIMCNFNTLTFTQTNFFPNSFSNDSTSIDSFLTIFETLLQTAFRKILTIFLMLQTAGKNFLTILLTLQTPGRKFLTTF